MAVSIFQTPAVHYVHIPKSVLDSVVDKEMIVKFILSDVFHFFF